MLEDGNKVIYIYFADKIDDARVRYLMTGCTNLMNQHKPETLYFLFSSPGGSVTAGITFYNFLKSLPIEIVMHNVGNVASIAVIVFLSGSKRYAASHSSFVFHGVKYTLPAIDTTVNQMEEYLSAGKIDQDKIAGIIADETSITKEDMEKLFNKGESKDLAFALAGKVIHEIRDPKIPKGADFVSINFTGNSG